MNHQTSFPIIFRLLLLLALAVPCFAHPGARCELSLAALKLPAGSDGVLHLRVGEEETVPVALNTRYFSDRVKARPGPIGFYEQAMPAVSPGEDQPEPLFGLRIPEGSKLIYIVLWTELEKDSGLQWRSRQIDGTDWQAGSLKLLNSSPGTLEISAGKTRTKLASEKTMDFERDDWREPFPVKIYQLGEEPRLLFSSTWRVAADYRELCLVGNIDGAVSLRSLIDFGIKPSSKER